MPAVTATPRLVGNGQVITQFVDSVGLTSTTYTYPKTQELLAITNTGDADISVTVSGVTQTINRNKKWSKIVDFTSFSIVSSSGLQSFEAWSDEKGSVFDTPEGVYFQNNGGGGGSGGGAGITVYDTLTSLQNALPGGSTYPVWVTADQSWYYWTGTVTPSVPAAPSAPTATAGNNQVALTWTSVSGATSYKVYRNGALLSSPTTNSYTDTMAVNGTAYTYTVSAVNSAGESAQSSTASVTPVAPSTPPATPATPTATAGNAQVSLTWTVVSGATSYKVYRGGTLIASPTTNSYTDTTTVNGTSYSYTASAVNATGESAQSAAVSATPTAAPTVLFKDTFTGTDGTLLTEHTPDIGTASWISPEGSLQIIGNQLAGVDGNSTSVVDVGTGDVVITYTWKVNAEAYTLRLYPRYTDMNNRFIIDNDGDKFRLNKIANGVSTAIAMSTNTINIYAAQTIVVTLSGSAIKIDVGGTNYITATDTFNQTATKHGISLNGTTLRVDDFEIKTV